MALVGRADNVTDKVEGRPVKELTYKELQVLAMAMNLPGNLKQTSMISIIEARQSGQEEVVTQLLTEYKENRNRRRQENIEAGYSTTKRRRVANMQKPHPRVCYIFPQIISGITGSAADSSTGMLNNSLQRSTPSFIATSVGNHVNEPWQQVPVANGDTQSHSEDERAPPTLQRNLTSVSAIQTQHPLLRNCLMAPSNIKPGPSNSYERTVQGISLLKPVSNHTITSTDTRARGATGVILGGVPRQSSMEMRPVSCKIQPVLNKSNSWPSYSHGLPKRVPSNPVIESPMMLNPSAESPNLYFQEPTERNRVENLSLGAPSMIHEQQSTHIQNLSIVPFNPQQKQNHIFQKSCVLKTPPSMSRVVPNFNYGNHFPQPYHHAVPVNQGVNDNQQSNNDTRDSQQPSLEYIPNVKSGPGPIPNTWSMAKTTSTFCLTGSLCSLLPETINTTGRYTSSHVLQLPPVEIGPRNTFDFHLATLPFETPTSISMNNANYDFMRRHKQNEQYQNALDPLQPDYDILSPKRQVPEPPNNNQTSYPVLYNYLTADSSQPNRQDANMYPQEQNISMEEHADILQGYHTPVPVQQEPEYNEPEKTYEQMQQEYQETLKEIHRQQIELQQRMHQQQGQKQLPGISEILLPLPVSEPVAMSSPARNQDEELLDFSWQKGSENPATIPDVPELDDAALSTLYEPETRVVTLSTKGTCKFCSKTMTNAKMKQHEQYCDHTTVNCPTDGCAWEGRCFSLASHIHEEHSSALVKAGTASHVIDLHALRSQQRASFFQELKRNLFLVAVHCHGNLIFAVIQMLSGGFGGKASGYKGSLEVVGKDGKPHSWRGNIQSYLEDRSKLWNEKRCLMIDPAVIGAYAGSSLKLHVKISYGRCR